MCRNVLIYMDAVPQTKLGTCSTTPSTRTVSSRWARPRPWDPMPGLFKLVDKKFRIHCKRVSPVYPAVPFPADYATPGLAKTKATPKTGTRRNGVAERDQSRHSRAFCTRRRRGRCRHADRPVAGADREVSRAGARRGEPEPVEDGARRPAPRFADGSPYRPALQAGRPQGRLQVHFGNSWKDVSIEVLPLAAGGRPHFLILFEASEGGKPPQRKSLLRRGTSRPVRAGSAPRSSISCSASWPQAASTCSRSSRSSKPPTKSCSPRMRKSCRATRSGRAPTKSWTPPRRSCSRPTRSSIPSTKSCTHATTS